MITVSILINAQPIFTRTARNTMEPDKKKNTKYITDAGDVIWHKRKGGAVKLAVQMLKSIKEEPFK